MISHRLFSLIKRNVLVVPSRLHWNYQYVPGAFPKTHAERAEAARKYNMELADYAPYPDDGGGLGDYPKLQDLSTASKDNYYPWDYPELKRNFNEPLHLDSDHYGEDRYDIDQYYKLRPSFPVQVLQFLGAFTLWGVLMLIFEECKMFPAVVPKQFPHRGETHYTFDHCDAEDE